MPDFSDLPHSLWIFSQEMNLALSWNSFTGVGKAQAKYY